jgi:hypothetical protein
LGTTTSPLLKIVILREEEVPLYLEGKQVDSLTGAPQVIEYTEEEETYAEEPDEEAPAETEAGEAENA